MSDENEIVFWDHRDAERLQFDQPDDAILRMLEDAGDWLPDEVEIVGYRRMPVNAVGLAENVLEYVLEQLDEEFADLEYGSPTKATLAMRAACNTFMLVVQGEYTGFQCEPVNNTRDTVNVEAWVKENTDWCVARTPDGPDGRLRIVQGGECV